MENKEQKQRRLSKKEKGFVEDFVLTENGTQSILKHYDVKNEKVAGVMAVENLSKPRIQEAIEVKRLSLKEALEAQGITPAKIAEKVEVLLNASDEKGNTDYNAVDKGLKHATNIYGIEDQEKPKLGNTYNLLFTSETQADVKAIEERIKARLTQKNESIQED